MNHLPTEIEEVIKAEAYTSGENYGFRGVWSVDYHPHCNCDRDRFTANKAGYQEGATKWALGMQAAFRKAYSLGYEAGQIENGYHSDECWMAFISECRKIKQK